MNFFSFIKEPGLLFPIRIFHFRKKKQEVSPSEWESIKYSLVAVFGLLFQYLLGLEAIEIQLNESINADNQNLLIYNHLSFLCRERLRNTLRRINMG